MERHTVENRWLDIPVVEPALGKDGCLHGKQRSLRGAQLYPSRVEWAVPASEAEAP